jgi:hypothetical protein
LTATTWSLSFAQEELAPVVIHCKKTVSFVFMGVHYDYWDCGESKGTGWDIY